MLKLQHIDFSYSIQYPNTRDKKSRKLKSRKLKSRKLNSKSNQVQPQSIFKNLNLEIPTEMITCILGPSGCGKSTLLKLLNRTLIPSRGEITLDKKNLANLPPINWRRTIGHVFQNYGLFPHMTIAQNLKLIGKLDPQVDLLDIDTVLGQVELTPEVSSKYPAEISGGQKQRVGIARALISNPSLMLMDEPFSSLDPISKNEIRTHIRKLNSKVRKTIVCVTHDLEDIKEIADHVVILNQGKVEQIGSPTEILNNPTNSFVRNFLGVQS